MSKIDELLKNENVEWKKLGEVCEIKRGRVISKAYLEQNPGDFPVYSSQTRNNGEIGKINTYDFDGEYATWTTDGAYAGTVFYRNGKFSITNICGLIKPNDSKRLLVKYIVYWLQIEANKYVKGGSGNPKLMSNVVANIKIPIPSLETQEKIVKILDKFTNYVTELQAQLQAELQARNKQYEYYRDMLLSEEYLTKLTEEFYQSEDEISFDFVKISELCLRQRGIKITAEKMKSLDKEDSSVKVFAGGNTTANLLPEEVGIENIINKPSVIVKSRGNIDFEYYDRDFTHKNEMWSYSSLDEKKLNIKFLYYILKNNLRYFLDNAISGKLPQISTGVTDNYKVPLPSIYVQNKVVEVLNKFQNLLSDTQGLLPEEIEQRQKQYEYYREKLLTFDGNMLKRERERAYLSKSYLKSLKEAGEIVGVSFFNIEKKNLGEVSDIVLGGTPNKTKHEYWENGTIPWMSSGEVNKKKIYSTDNFITQAGYDNSSAIMVPADSTVIALAGQGKTRGLVARIKISLSTNQSLATLIPKDIIINDYLYYYLESQYNKLREVSSGDGSRGGLNKEILKRYPIIIPTIPVQEQVVSILDKFDKLVNDINEGLPKEIELRQKQYEYYRERLLNFPK